MNSFMTENETTYQKLSSSDLWSSQAVVEFPVRAMSFGDGLFETMVFDHGEIRFFDKHIKRLFEGMGVLGLKSEDIKPRELLHFLRESYPDSKLRVRWNVVRAGKGKYTPECNEVMQTLQLSEFKAASAVKESADVSLKIHLFPTPWANLKTLNALPYVLANLERAERGLDEIILMDYRGFVSEAGASNVFWVKDEVIYTPSLSCSCINGISRQAILDQLTKKSVPFHEGEYKISELEVSDQIFVSNCTGISYLSRFRGRGLDIRPLDFLELIFH
ncbi:aminotransferase class IV [Algoriphagus sp. AGSA1]|uniref:aminotransferase class IV n=1 Tax=Algoriphagus sp. AGSA1 TaxID=2907213 RepID=UPI001F273EAC|nr:aminotransferase class IV [Algoriphagus sp. AGSA1]MCE7055569.1 aminotransferase class IV [Algoriphagus sp. AGSA1]